MIDLLSIDANFDWRVTRAGTVDYMAPEMLANSPLFEVSSQLAGLLYIDTNYESLLPLC